MNVASLELSKKLYELSGWGETDFWHTEFFNISSSVPDKKLYELVGEERYGDYEERTYLKELEAYPAYDAGYLLRKLPAATYIRKNIQKPKKTIKWNGEYTAACGFYLEENYLEYSNNPEDALCKLAIKLFEEGVL